MGNRLIKESICSSDNIDHLTLFEETFFYRLIVNCDDYGRMDARPKILKSRLYPLKDELPDEQIQSALDALARENLIIRYECEGRPYLQMRTWEKHQSVRARKSKYPEPKPALMKSSEIIGNQLISDEINGNQMNTDEINGNHLNANVTVIQSNTNTIRIQSESESNPNTNTTPQTAVDAFDVFWEHYPKKVGKGAARTSFAKVRVPIETLIAAIEQQKRSDQWKRGYVPNPATWLNQGRWEDQLEESRQFQTNNPFLKMIMEEENEQNGCEENLGDSNCGIPNVL